MRVKRTTESTGMLTVSEVARRKGCTLKYVYDLLQAGRLPGAVKNGKTWKIPEQALGQRANQAA